jgi:hypothetical protein
MWDWRPLGFRLRGNAAAAAESRRESALVDVDMSGSPFRLVHALFKIRIHKAKESRDEIRLHGTVTLKAPALTVQAISPSGPTARPLVPATYFGFAFLSYRLLLGIYGLTKVEFGNGH